MDLTLLSLSFRALSLSLSLPGFSGGGGRRSDSNYVVGQVTLLFVSGCDGNARSWDRPRYRAAGCLWFRLEGDG